MALETDPSLVRRRAEEVLRGLLDVEGVRVMADASGLREIHVVTSSLRPAKQIVRDIESALLAEMDLAIDHRIVSIARGRAEAAPRAEEPGTDRRAPRIRFVSVNLFVSGPRTQAQVELRWRGVTRMGSATGWTTRAGASRLVAAAAAQAVQQFVDESVGFGIHDVTLVRIGNRRAAVVSVALIGERQERLLSGVCPITTDAQQSVVLATLGALNRIVDGLPGKETASTKD